MKRIDYSMAVLLLAFVWSGEAMALICTTNAGTGTWNTVSTWSCGRVPLTTDTVVISRNITLDANRTVAGLTINTGVVLNDAGRVLTVAGNVINNGTYGVSGGGGRILMTAAGTSISGTGAFNDADLYVDANNITLPVGSTMNFRVGAQIRVGSGSTASFTIAGTITDTGATSGNRIMRVYGGSTLTINGALNVPNSYLQIRSGGTVLNGGTVAMRYLDGSSAANVVWSQLTNASLTITMPVVAWGGTFDANATGNTVTYNGTSTPLTPSANTYFNLAGTGVTCPHGFTVIGSDPCAGSSLVSVTLNPSNCVNVTGIGTLAWGTPANAIASDNVYTTVTLNDFQTSNYLRCTGYGFAIPAGATISGITVRVERKASNTTVQDAAMRLVRDASGAPVIQTTNRSTTTVYTTADVSEPHGGVADLWAAAWTPTDINSANFGAAFAAIKPGSAGGGRIVSVDHMPITVTYSAPPAAPYRMQIDHDGAGLTCRAETLTVKACANAACTANITNATVTGNVTWGSPVVSIPFTITSGGTGQTTVSLSVTTPQTVTLGTSAVTPVQTNPPSICTNSSGGAACSMTFAAATACFDAVEVGAATGTNIYTKRSGTVFTLDVLAGSAYTGNLKVELVDASIIGTCAAYTQLQLSANALNFSNQTRQTFTFPLYSNAAKNVKVRITGAAAASCSTDRFSIRPDSFTSVTSNMTNTGTSGTPKAVAGTLSPAGAGLFDLTVATGLSGYTGTPKIDNTALQAHANAIQKGTVDGAFPAAVSGTSNGTGVYAFAYSEVGNFRFLGSAAALGSTTARGVYDDTFTAVDQPNDCTNDFSNTLSGGKYGCKFGLIANSSYFGRFYPHHFDTVITEVTPKPGAPEFACDDGFTYSAQPFIVSVEAKNSASVLTQNYDRTAGFSKATTLSDGNAVAGGTLNNSALLATTFVAGIGNTLDPTTASSPNYSFTIAQTTPVTIKLRATENAGADGVSSSAGTTEDVMEIRSGRLVLGNAHGSELLGLSIPVELRYWIGGNYVTNTEDNCTVIPATSITMGSYTKNLVAPCKTWLSPNGDLELFGGQSPEPMQLSAPGSGNNGSVDLLVNVGTTASGYTCFGATESAATAANVPWLTTNTARATFGVYKGANEFIYQRENY